MLIEARWMILGDRILLLIHEVSSSLKLESRIINQELVLSTLGVFAK